jgi:hypothetical protein
VWDVLVTATIVVPLVVGSVLLLLRSRARADENATRALVARLDCPRCLSRSLVWEGMVWAEDILYDDNEQSCGGSGGYVLSCRQCGDKFEFTDDGDLHPPDVEPSNQAGT